MGAVTAKEPSTVVKTQNFSVAVCVCTLWQVGTRFREGGVSVFN